MPAQPFDAAAIDYDRIFTDPVPGRWFRETVWNHVHGLFKTGDAVLDLGCGTGEDAVWLAQQGFRVTAVDISKEMLQTARRKAEEAGLSESITFMANDLSDLKVPAGFDGALSDFGAVNCVEELKGLASRLSDAIKPGGTVVFVVMGPACPWEIAWYLLHGKLGQAVRRFKRSVDAPVADGESIRVWYPSPRRFRSAFAPHFKKVKTVGIGTLVPPPYLGGLVNKCTRLFHLLWRMEYKLGSWPPFTWLNDHYLMILKKC